MKKIVLLTALIIFVTSAFAQKATKGYKDLDDKNYEDARKLFESELKDDPNDVAANYGMSRYYGATSHGERDTELSLEHLVKAEEGYAKMDEKGKDKLEKAGLTSGDLISRRDKVEKTFFEYAKKDNAIPVYEKFAARFPESKYALNALELRDGLAYDQAKSINTIEAYTQYLKKYPDSYGAKEARQKRNIMAADKALKENTVEGFQFFVENYPESPSAEQMKQRLYGAAWEEVQKINTPAAYSNYAQKYPESVFAEKAKARASAMGGQ
jgi:outer membrane protein assembly factor BamD (BamD/ComL family)